MKSYDVIVIGAGVVGASVAFHLAALGARNVLVLDRGAIGAPAPPRNRRGILRTHYSVRENVELARRSWGAFTDFAAYVGDDDAASGLVRCGYLIAAADDDSAPLAAALQQRALGIPVHELDAAQAREAAADRRFRRCRADRLRAGGRFRRRLPGRDQLRARRSAGAA